ncbi:MAG TPA: hypothetical protein VH518_01480 [Tepidisphaeraceae bacterium]|jgi:Tfp pilus assembly protein PilX
MRTFYPEQLRIRHRRRGAVYLAVLAVCLIVITLGIGGILAARVQARASDGGGDMAEARLAALSGMELARFWMAQDPNWRTTRGNGNWTTNLPTGNGATVSIDLADPIDGDLTNHPHDPVTVTTTGQKGQARQVLQVTLSARPVPLAVLRFALHTGGLLRVDSPYRIRVGSATASTNGQLRNDSTIEGNAVCQSLISSGIVCGTLQTGVAPRPLPDSSVPETYASLGTLINPGTTTIDGQVLAPGRNPWGTPDPDGVYVIRSSSDLTIRNTRINGTLVIIAPSNTVTIDSQVFFHPARADYPTLIVNGSVNLNYTSSGNSLSEATTGINFNPPDAPYNGFGDADLADSYPSEIWGLVHITGQINVSRPGIIRGAMICESQFRAQNADLQVVYDPALYTNPPQYYTTGVQMVPLAGSFKQIVN